MPAYIDPESYTLKIPVLLHAAVPEDVPLFPLGSYSCRQPHFKPFSIKRLRFRTTILPISHVLEDIGDCSDMKTQHLGTRKNGVRARLLVGVAQLSTIILGPPMPRNTIQKSVCVCVCSNLRNHIFLNLMSSPSVGTWRQ